MTTSIADKARLITRASSIQTYYTILLLVDKDLVDDCFCAYAYLRWVDDVIDLSSSTRKEMVSFIYRQRLLIDRLYKNDQLDHLNEEEELIAYVISHERGENSGLKSFIYNFLAILEFDVYRKDQFINQSELNWYSNRLAKSVTDGIQYFICNCYPYPESEYRYLAANGAHITHMLRDMVEDISEGYVNIPQEFLHKHNIDEIEFESPLIKAWVRDRVELARRYFIEGKRYLDDIEVLRCKIAGYWYCARFEVILDAIEKDEYILRANYNGRRKISTWIRIGWLGLSIAFKHFTQGELWNSSRRPAFRI
jgi:phytoene/squalene synthetase